MKIVNCKLRIMSVAVLFLAAVPFYALADGLVPCSGVDCTFCHFFTLFQNIFNFAVTILAPAVAVFGVAYGGYWILIGGANPSNVTKGKDALKNTAIGFVIVYASYAIASTLVWFLATGVIGGTGIQFGFSNGTFQFACSSKQIEDVTSNFMKNGVISITIDEVEPTVPIGVLPSETTKSAIIVKKSNDDVVINSSAGSLDDDVQKYLSSASVDADTNGIELVVTSGYRSVEEQNALVKDNCPIKATSSKECSPPTCIPTGDGSNCNHTTGNAVDVKGRNPDTGTQCASASNCQKNVTSIMKKNGFCVLISESWHFELKSHVEETNRESAFYCP